jgi:hypothetical protein
MDIEWGWKCGWLCWMSPDWEKLEGQHCLRLVCQRGNSNWSTAGALKLFFRYRTGHNHFFTELVSLESFGYGSGCSLPEVFNSTLWKRRCDWLQFTIWGLIVCLFPSDSPMMIKDPLSPEFCTGPTAEPKHQTRTLLLILYIVRLGQSRLFTDRTPYNTIDFKAVKTKRWDCFTL